MNGEEGEMEKKEERRRKGYLEKKDSTDLPWRRWIFKSVSKCLSNH